MNSAIASDVNRTGGDAEFLRRERTLVVLFIVSVSLFLTHFVHDGWLSLIGAQPVARPGAAPVHRYAPDVYRVGMPVLDAALVRLLHIRTVAMMMASSDLLFVVPALFCGYLLAVRGVPVAERMHRTVIVGFYLAAVQVPLAWVVPYQRPETLPTALYLLLAMLLLGQLRRSPLWAVAVVLLTLLQALLRTDAPLALGASLVLLSLAGDRLHDLAPRRVTLLTGCGIVLAAAGMQAYLQFVRFPHSEYPPGTPVLMLPVNFGLHYMGSLCMILLPLLALLAAAWRVRSCLPSTHWLTISAALLFLPLWMTVGSTAEVRIFVPFLLSLCPVAAVVLPRWLGVPVRGNQP